VLEVYERPLSAEEPVVCVDEKPVTLHNDVREPLSMKPASVAKRDNEYERLWNRECILRHRTASRSSLYEGHSNPVVAGICRLPPVHRQHYPTAQTVHLKRVGRCGIGSPFITRPYTEVG